MTEREPRLTTEVLNRFAAGDASLEAVVVEQIHRELRQLADAQMARAARGRTLQPTALVHEAWLRLAQGGALEFGARRQFFRFAATLMRNLLVDRARGAANARREAGLTVSSLDLGDGQGDPLDALALGEAIERLDGRDPESARVLELRLLCGLSNADVAGVLECSERTVERRWRFARAWLVGELER